MATAPTGFRLKAVGASSGTVTTGGIQWDAVTGADSYKLYWGTASNSLTSSQDVGNVTSFDWSGLSPAMQQGTTYYVQVRTIDNSVESEAWGTTVWLDGSQVG